eukprot:scaffold17373_cov116-Isochrysis_galbana.AAC.4
MLTRTTISGRSVGYRVQQSLTSRWVRGGKAAEWPHGCPEVAEQVAPRATRHSAHCGVQGRVFSEKHHPQRQQFGPSEGRPVQGGRNRKRKQTNHHSPAGRRLRQRRLPRTTTVAAHELKRHDHHCQLRGREVDASERALPPRLRNRGVQPAVMAGGVCCQQVPEVADHLFELLSVTQCGRR